MRFSFREARVWIYREFKCLFVRMYGFLTRRDSVCVCVCVCMCSCVCMRVRAYACVCVCARANICMLAWVCTLLYQFKTQDESNIQYFCTSPKHRTNHTFNTLLNQFKTQDDESYTQHCFAPVHNTGRIIHSVFFCTSSKQDGS